METEAFQEEVVVEGYLAAGWPIGVVRVSRTAPIDREYRPDSFAVDDADVSIELLTANGSVEASYTLLPLGDAHGRYRTRMPQTVLPLRTYRLVVRVPGVDAPITAETTVPGAFEALGGRERTFTYRSGDPPVFTFSRSSYPGRQSVFVVSTFALDVDASQLTPFARGRFEDGSETLATLRTSTSPLINEENFERTIDGDLLIRYPWLGLNFYGRNRLQIQAIDDNLHDFLRTQSVQQGGSTLPPGEIPGVIEHVEGGRGVFGSYARADVGFRVLRNPNLEDGALNPGH